MLWTSHPSHGETWYFINEPKAKFDQLDGEVMVRNGHNSFLRGGRWILSDTSPDRDRKQHQYLYDTKTRQFEFKRVEYDIDAAATKIFESSLERNFGHRLFIGV